MSREYLIAMDSHADSAPRDVSNAWDAGTSAEGGAVWWHRRILLVSENATWISSMRESAPERTGVVESTSWDDVIKVTGPIGTMVCHIDHPARLTDALPEHYERWSSLAWQPCTQTWIASRPGAARVRMTLLRHGFEALCTPVFTLSSNGKRDPWEVLRRRIDSAPWVVSYLARRLQWARDPRLVEVLAAPVLERKISTVRQWGRRLRLSYGELADVCREHRACRPKWLLDVVRLSTELARVRANGRSATRRQLARRLDYASGDYLGRRVKELSGHTLGSLMTMPLMEALGSLSDVAIEVSKQDLY